MNSDKEKIGLGIITCNRPDLFTKSAHSIPDYVDLIAVNDGKPYENSVYPPRMTKIIQHDKNMGIGRSKNDVLKFFVDNGYEHIFIMEDDIAIRDPEIFNKYIELSKATGIFHFNYGYHGFNMDSSDLPQPRKKIRINDHLELALLRNITGALSYFRRVVIEDAGYFDTFYKNVLEHVDHTYQIIKAGYHTPFFWFADLWNSHTMIEELDPKLTSSLNRRFYFLYRVRVKLFRQYFKFKNGIALGSITDSSEDEVVKVLALLKARNCKNENQ